jgi:hypothetical protein
VSGIGRPHRFPVLRDTAEWERRERIKGYAAGAVIVAIFFAAIILGGCNGAHGRC